jgi:Domain of unknown function (DUF4377)
MLVVAACGGATEPGTRVLTLEVAAAKVVCTGSFQTMCLQTRERSDQPFTLFYDVIEGFAFEAGYRYLLRVRESPVREPPADGSSLRYTLIRTLSKTPAVF